MAVIGDDLASDQRCLQWVALLSNWERSMMLDRFGEALDRVALVSLCTGVSLFKTSF